MELKTDHLVNVLERLADAGEAQWVVVEFPPSQDWPPPPAQEPEVADTREFIAVMKEKDE